MYDKRGASFRPLLLACPSTFWFNYLTPFVCLTPFQEIYPPRCSDYALTTDGAYNVEQICEIEHKILQVRRLSHHCSRSRLLYIWRVYHLTRVQAAHREGSGTQKERHTSRMMHIENDTHKERHVM